jgi:hypothetical protein
MAETPHAELARLKQQREDVTDSQILKLIDRRIEVLERKLKEHLEKRDS